MTLPPDLLIEVPVDACGTLDLHRDRLAVLDQRSASAPTGMQRDGGRYRQVQLHLF